VWGTLNHTDQETQYTGSKDLIGYAQDNHNSRILYLYWFYVSYLVPCASKTAITWDKIWYGTDRGYDHYEPYIQEKASYGDYGTWRGYPGTHRMPVTDLLNVDILGSSIYIVWVRFV
jgi:hypothetical protein